MNTGYAGSMLPIGTSKRKFWHLQYVRAEYGRHVNLVHLRLWLSTLPACHLSHSRLVWSLSWATLPGTLDSCGFLHLQVPHFPRLSATLSLGFKAFSEQRRLTDD